MRFEILLSMVLMLSACSSVEFDEKSAANRAYVPVNLGEAPKTSVSPLTTSAVAQDTVIFADANASAAHRFRVGQFRLDQSWELADTAKTGGILVGQEAKYVIGLSGSDIAIQGQAGYLFNPLRLPGKKISSVAFDPNKNLVALSDEYEAIALMAMSAEGAVTGSWLGGPVLGDGVVAGTGGFINGSRLLMSLGSSKFAVIDVPSSIAAQAWQYRVIDLPDIERATLIAPVPGAEQLALVGDAKILLILDVETGQVRARRPLAGGSVVLPSNLGNPHIALVEANAPAPLKIIYPNAQGEFLEKSLKTRLVTGTLSEEITGVAVERSHLDLSRGLWTVVATGLSASKPVRMIVRYRLTDSLVLDASELPTVGDIAITSEYFVLRYPSALGAAEQRRYGRTPEAQSVEKFNLKAFRREQQ